VRISLHYFFDIFGSQDCVETGLIVVVKFGTKPTDVDVGVGNHFVVCCGG
jgi:hypothetical protein